MFNVYMIYYEDKAGFKIPYLDDNNQCCVFLTKETAQKSLNNIKFDITNQLSPKVVWVRKKWYSKTLIKKSHNSLPEWQRDILNQKIKTLHIAKKKMIDVR